MKLWIYFILALTFGLGLTQQGKHKLNYGNFTIDWKVAEDKKSITFKIFVVNAPGWIGFGFTQNNTDMGDADLIIGQVNQLDKTKLDVKDFWSKTEGKPKEDDTQNFLHCEGSRDPSSNTAKMEFTRLLDTGDELEDIVIPLDDGVHIMWAYSASDEVLTDKGHKGGRRGYAPRKVLFNVSDPDPNEGKEDNLFSIMHFTFAILVSILVSLFFFK